MLVGNWLKQRRQFCIFTQVCVYDIYVRGKGHPLTTPRPVQTVKQRPNRGQYNSANQNSANNNGANFTSNRFQRTNNAQINYDKCKMCGQRSHDASKCQNIWDDQGKVIKMIVPYNICSKCPNFIKPRLHHPDNLCIYRNGGPLNRQNRMTN